MSIIEKAVRGFGGKNDSGTENRSNDPDLENASPAATDNRDIGATNSRGKRAELTDNSNLSPAQRSSGVLNVPISELHALGMVTQLAPRSETAEAFRIVKRPLIMNMAGDGAADIDNANMIMVTSALQGEGKTFCTISLAMSIAMEQDKTVLLVDADTAKASAGKLCGVPHNALGLVDVLENENIGLEDVIVSTNIPNLRIVPAGNVHERSTELLASDNMRVIMKQLSERYLDRVVIFDSPPILLATEASVLAHYMGQIVFVVAAEDTSQHAIKEALQYLGNDQIVGMLLNKYRPSPLDKFGHGYGYGYGYGYGQRNRSRENPEEGNVGMASS
ncbi:MAG: protein tyrosine kinase [Cellvibrionales bacterium]|nr:MAG: protein tyrosine kinase [Cellvibrionales bacterium]